MADQTKEVTRFVIGPALVTEVGKEVLVNPPSEKEGIDTLLHTFRFPAVDSKVKELIKEARQNVREGRGSTAFVTAKYTYQCTDNFDQDNKINEDQCSLTGVRIGFLEKKSDQSTSIQPFPKDKKPEVKFASYEPSFLEKTFQATGERLLDFTEWIAKFATSRK